MSITIVVDDLGISPGVNAAVAKVLPAEAPLRASLLVNGGYVEDALHIIREAPDLPIGLHLNLTYGRPLLRPHLVPLLVDRHGIFKRSTLGYAMDLVRKGYPDLRHQIRLEVEAQLARAKDVGIRWSHVDSHEHVHCVPAIWEILMDARGRHEIGRIRIIRESVTTTFCVTRDFGVLSPRGLMRHLFLRFIGPRSWQAESRYFLSLLLSGRLEHVRLASLNALAQKVEVEIMLHPGNSEIDSEIDFRDQRVARHLKDPSRDGERHLLVDLIRFLRE